MPSTTHRLRSQSRLLAIACLGLLLVACATPNSTWDMTEAQRIRAANNGDIAAIRALQSSSYVLKDKSLAYRTREETLKWLIKGAEVGDGSSQCRLAITRLYGSETLPGAERNPAEARRLALAAVESLQRPNNTNVASSPSWVGNARTVATRAETILRLQPLAENGDAEAMWGLS
jgi:hypothetical protein